MRWSKRSLLFLPALRYISTTFITTKSSISNSISSTLLEMTQTGESLAIPIRDPSPRKNISPHGTPISIFPPYPPSVDIRELFYDSNRSPPNSASIPLFLRIGGKTQRSLLTKCSRVMNDSIRKRIIGEGN